MWRFFNRCVKQGPYVASMFNTVDAFDIHNEIYSYMETLEEVGKSNTLCMVSTGWDQDYFLIKDYLVM